MSNYKPTETSILQRLWIENYLVFKEKQLINFAIPNGLQTGSGLTVIVGPNNTGKTSILKAIIGYKDQEVMIEQNRSFNSTLITIEYNNNLYSLSAQSGINKGEWIREENLNNSLLGDEPFKGTDSIYSYRERKYRKRF